MKRRFNNITDTSSKKRGTVLLCAVTIVIALAGCAVHASEAVEQNQSLRALQEDAEKFDMRVSDFSPDEMAPTYEPAELSKHPYSGGAMAWPFPGNSGILAPFGENPQTPNDYHTGIDISGEQGDTIIAARNGTVRLVSTEWTPGVGYGMYVIIDHGGDMSTLYAHCSEILVSEGQNVFKGDKVAEAGATGFATEPHLHFEVRLAGAAVDPMPYITSTGFIWPTTDGGYISAGVGAYPGHTGMDIAGLPEGTPVYAAAAGTVTLSKDSHVGYGKYITIDHGNGYQTLYAHNSELYVGEGDIVTQGQAIAAIGRSGNATDYMLHFEIRRDGEMLDPVDFLTAPFEFYPLDYPAESNPLDYAEYEWIQDEEQYNSDN